MSRSVIVSTARTPFAKLGGGLADKQATELGAIAIEAALERARVEPGEVEYVIMGQVLQAGAGQAPARQAAVAAGIPKEVGADTIKRCGVLDTGIELTSPIRAATRRDRQGGRSRCPRPTPQAGALRYGWRGTLIDSMTTTGDFDLDSGTWSSSLFVSQSWASRVRTGSLGAALHATRG